MQDVNSFPGNREPLPPPPPTGFSAATPLPPTLDRTWLRELAARQRWAIVGGIANGVGGILIGVGAIPPGLGAVLGLAAGIFVIVAAFRLANHLYGVGLAVVSAIAMIVPLVWIIVLVVLCVKATGKLRAAGVRVGLFGTDPDRV
jgi:hypothetical protein